MRCSCLSLLTLFFLQAFTLRVTRPGHPDTDGSVYPYWEDVEAIEFLAEKELNSSTQEVLREKYNGVDLIGIIEYPYSGSTWLRFLLAGSIGLPTCSKYLERQSSCIIDMGWKAYCPCSAYDLAHFSPRGWTTSKENTAQSQVIQDAFEYIPGTRVHAWSSEDRVLLRKSHLHGSQSKHIQEVKELNKLVLMIRHPLEVMHSNKKHGHQDTIQGINQFYENMIDLATTNFNDTSLLIVMYESLCANTASELMKVLAFLGKANTVKHSRVQRMLNEWPELACRFAKGETLNSSMEFFGDSVGDILRDLQPAMEVWHRFSD